jgi:hypothetical protein
MGTVGPWGWHLPLKLKWALTISSTSYVYYELTDDQQDYWVDMGAVLGWGFSMYGLWAPPVVKLAIAAQVGLAVGRLAAPAAPVIAVTAVALVTGDLISHAIDPESGRKNFRDFVDPFQLTKMPGRIAFTAETIYEHKIEEPLAAAASRYVGWVDRRIDEMQSVWAVTMPQSRW